MDGFNPHEPPNPPTPQIRVWSLISMEMCGPCAKRKSSFLPFSLIPTSDGLIPVPPRPTLVCQCKPSATCSTQAKLRPSDSGISSESIALTSTNGCRVENR